MLNPNRDSAVLVLASAFFAGCLICWSIVCLGPKLTLAVAIIPLALPFVVTYAAMTERGILDPTALFPAFFGAYNGIPLIRFLSDDFVQRLSYPVKFEPNTYFRAGLLSALAAIFIAITWAVWRRPAHQKKRELDRTGWFNVGSALYIFGMLLYQLQYLQVGGYWAALAIERTRRFEVMAETTSLPYFAFVLVGLVMTAAASNSRRRRVATILMTLLWSVLVVVQGDRRLLLQTVVAVLGASLFVAGESIKIGMKHVVLVVVAYAALAVVGQLREQIPRLVSDTGSQHTIVDSDRKDSLLDSVTPGNAELGAPFLSVLYNSEYVTDYRMGRSYLDTIPCIFPRIIYHSKPPSPAAELANEVNRGQIFGFSPAGWGYSPVAEAFLNFGTLGVCLVSSLWMVAFIALSHLRNYRWGLVTAAVLTPETINANRIDFRTVYLEAFSCIAVVLIAIFIVKSLHHISPRRLSHGMMAERTYHHSSQEPRHLEYR